MHELLTPEEMSRADRLAISAGPVSGIELMRNAGRAVASEILSHYPETSRAEILCGPGNNGGDGYVIATELARAGISVAVYALAPPGAGTDAAIAAAECGIESRSIDAFSPASGTLVVDALFGAGLERPLAGGALEAVERTKEVRCTVVAVDLPSGVSGASGEVLGGACPADKTVTFFRKKPGHLLYPGRELCGDLVLADIGIGEFVLGDIGPACFESDPQLWADQLPTLVTNAHKYSRGAVGVFSGGPTSTGAARLSALAAQRAGAGAVTVHSPASALLVNASHLTSIMLNRLENIEDIAEVLKTGRTRSFVLGPGFGIGEKTCDFAIALLAPAAGHNGLVLDADGLTSFAGDAATELFDREKPDEAPSLVLTPHEGEFARLFPELATNDALSKLDRARAAAKQAQATIIYKGPDTVVASPDGRAAINTNGTPWLATAGSGDVLAGVVAALLAQDMPAFEAACASVWLHAETGRLAGRGAIAEDLVHHVGDAWASLD